MSTTSSTFAPLLVPVVLTKRCEAAGGVALLVSDNRRDKGTEAEAEHYQTEGSHSYVTNSGTKPSGRRCPCGRRTRGVARSLGSRNTSSCAGYPMGRCAG